MTHLLERLTPYLDQQEAEYTPGLCCVVASAAYDGAATRTEADTVLDAVEADRRATGSYYVFKVLTFSGTRAERIRQWRKWAESLLQSVDIDK